MTHVFLLMILFMGNLLPLVILRCHRTHEHHNTLDESNIKIDGKWKMKINFVNESNTHTKTKQI